MALLTISPLLHLHFEFWFYFQTDFEGHEWLSLSRIPSCSFLKYTPSTLLGMKNIEL